MQHDSQALKRIAKIEKLKKKLSKIEVQAREVQAKLWAKENEWKDLEYQIQELGGIVPYHFNDAMA